MAARLQSPATQSPEATKTLCGGGSPAITFNTININGTGIFEMGGSATISGNYLSGGSGSNYGVNVTNGTTNIQNNSFTQYPSHEAILLGSTGGVVTGSVYGNTISGCMYPLGFPGDTIPSITFNANNISGCSLLGINLNVSLASTTITNYGIPYIVSGMTVNSGATVHISPGAILKIKGSTLINVRGTLNAIGTPANPIIFTSLRDDSAGGDTNNDGSVTTPQPNDWNYIGITKGNFDYVTLSMAMKHSI